MAIGSDRMVFYYMARDNLCFLTLCEESYPKRLAFLYLDEIADLILQELLQEYGTNVRIGTHVRSNEAFFHAYMLVCARARACAESVSCCSADGRPQGAEVWLDRVRETSTDHWS